jgi:hypothetical protein
MFLVDLALLVMFLVDLALLVGLASYGRVDKRIMIRAKTSWRLFVMSTTTIMTGRSATYRLLPSNEERVAIA